ncbi:MAG: ferritin-like domain-containing protein [Myxococcota bacterium]
MSNTNILERLNDAVQVEHTLAMHCHQYELTVAGLWRLTLAPFFRDLGDEARDHARKFGQKLVALGATPTCAVDDVANVENPAEMIARIVVLERKAMELYKEALSMVPDEDVALRTMLEDQIEAEQRHIEELDLVAAPMAADAPDELAVRRAS